MDLEYGTTYYQITYADPKLTMPGLKPMIYIGENIFRNESDTLFYFQDTVSILIFGLFGEAKNTTDCHISSFFEDDLGSSIVTIDVAAKLVDTSAKRSKELGYPKLKKASDIWHDTNL